MKLSICILLSASIVCNLLGLACAATYNYDELDRLKTVTYSNGQVVSYAYDAGGNMLSAVTGLPDTTPPAVLSLLPAGEGKNVPVGLTLSAVFDEPLKADTVKNSSFSVSSQAGDVPGTVSYSSDTKTAWFVPTAPLSHDTVFTATLGTGIADLYGNNLAAPVSWRFTTIVLDTTPPTTTPSVLPGAYPAPQNVSLSCLDGTGSGCATTYYCLGSGCTPAALFSSAIAVPTSTILRFSSTDIAGNNEVVKEAQYTIIMPPDAPTNVTATPGNTQATVSFAAPAANGGGAISVYTVASTPAGGTDSAAGSTSLSRTISGLTNGQTYMFTVTATNIAGVSPASTSNSVTPVGTQTIDFAPLTARTIGDENFTLTATATSGLGVSYASSNQSVATTNGATVSIVGAGTTTITASQAGNSAWLPAPSVSQSLTVNYATVKPTLTVSTLNNGTFTKQADLNISGSATSVNGIKAITINGENQVLEGSFSYHYLLVPGPNIITTVATDKADQTTSDIRTITLDQTAPHLVVTVPVDNSAANSPLLTVSGSVDDPTATVGVALNGGDPQAASMNGLNFSHDLTLNSGLNTIQVTATDLALNSSSLARSITYDSQAPSLAVTTPATDITTNLADLTLSGTVADALTAVIVTITCDGQTYTPEIKNGAFSQPLIFTTAKTYSIIVTATDAADNKATVQRNVNYQPIRIITVTTAPAGRSITVDGTSYTAPQPFSWLTGSSHTIATTATQNGTPGTRYIFANWSDAGTVSHDIIVPNTPATYTATFGAQYQLTTAVSPVGSGIVSPVASGTWFNGGTDVAIASFPSGGYSFINWTGPVANSNSATTSVTMSGPQSITANNGGSPVLFVTFSGKSGDPNARIWNITASNSGQTTATDARITGITLVRTYGTPCTPVINKTQFPVLLGDITSVTPSTGSVTIDFSACLSTNRYTATISYSSNGGAVTGSKSYGNQFR